MLAPDCAEKLWKLLSVCGELAILSICHFVVLFYLP